jgi:hypothetical protein
MIGAQRSDVVAAVEKVRLFVERAGEATDAKEAADWALAAKNMASAVHSLVSGRITLERGGRT